MSRKKYEVASWLKDLPPLSRRLWRIVNYPETPQEELRASEIIKERAAMIRQAKNIFKVVHLR